MAEKIWYIYEDGLPIYVYESRADAQRAIHELLQDVAAGNLELQSVFMSDLEEFENEYRQEYDLALDEGLC